MLVGVAAGGQHGAVGVEHGDLVDREPGHGGGDEMADGRRQGRSPAVSVRTMTDAEGVWRSAPEGAGVGQHDVDAGGLDALHGLDGAGELAFQGAHAGHLLHEGGEAHGAQLVEQLVAGRWRCEGRPFSASSMRACAVCP